MKKLLIIILFISTNVYSQFTTSITSINISCNSNDTNTTISVNGGTPKYIHRLSQNGSAIIRIDTLNVPNFTYQNLTPAVYTVNSTDANQFTATVNFVINTPPPTLTSTVTFTNVSCAGADNGLAVINATGGLPPYQYRINSEPDTNNNTFSNLVPGNYNGQVIDANGCFALRSFSILTPNPLIASYTVSGQDITVNATGGTIPYLYSLNGGGFQSSNFFSGLSTGSYTILIRDANFCELTLNSVVNVAAPTFNGSSEPSVNVELPSGSTLADIGVSGNNIKWYSAAVGLRGTANRNSNQTSELPLNTPIVYGTTYYASQTVNGFESQLRLAVTAVNPLSNENFTFKDLKHYPNPVQNSFNFSNSKIIDAITITDIYGKLIVSKTINNFNSEIDLSGLLTGMYFTKINSENQEKVIKIIKN